MLTKLNSTFPLQALTLSSSLSKLSVTLYLIAFTAWLTSNRLSLNPSKTEYLLIGTTQQRSKVTSTSLSFAGSILTPSKQARNLGVIFDPDLSFKSHISNNCRTSFFQIRQLRQIRSSLDNNSAIILANALVSSKLLTTAIHSSILFLISVPPFLVYSVSKIHSLGVVVPSIKRSQHISPTLCQTSLASLYVNAFNSKNCCSYIQNPSS